MSPACTGGTLTHTSTTCTSSTGQGAQHGYDGVNRWRLLLSSTGGAESYSYDPFDRRIFLTNNVNLVYDGGALDAEYANSDMSSPVALNIHGPKSDNASALTARRSCARLPRRRP